MQTAPGAGQAIEQALDQGLGRTTALVQGSAEADRWPWVFARCWMLVLKVEQTNDARPVIGQILADFAALPPGVPGRRQLAAVIVVTIVQRGMVDDPAICERAVELADVAGPDPGTSVDWPAVDAVARATHLMHRTLRPGTTVFPRESLAELDRCVAAAGDRQPYAMTVRLSRLSFLSMRAQADRDHAGLEQVALEAERLHKQSSGDPRLGSQAGLLALLMRALVAVFSGDLDGAQDHLDRIAAARDRLATDNPLHHQAESMLSQLRAPIEQMQALRAGGSGWHTVDQRPGPSADWQPGIDTLRRQAQVPGLPDAERAARLAALGVTEAASGPGRIDDAVAHLKEAVALSPAQDAHRPFYQSSLGGALLVRYELRPARPDLDESISSLVQARTAYGSPVHPQWARVSHPLAHAYRLAGRGAVGRSVALGGLRGHAWNVLVQADTATATTAAQDAAADAFDVAHWCLEDGDVPSAIAALDAGRGLILFAATERRGVTERLTALGDIPLSRRWAAAAAAGPVPIDLRREAWSVLTGARLDGGTGTGDARARLLDPPALAEIQQAVRALDLSALVYLLPAGTGSGAGFGDGLGAAVVVPPPGAGPSWIPLPDLRHVTETDLRAAVAAVADRSRDAARKRQDGARPGRTLEDICDWAWQAAVEPLLRHLGPTDRRPRLALVPMRELALVPWHAARRRTVGRHEFAVERAEFSYIPSARLLCDAAEGRPPKGAGAALIVGDPFTGDERDSLPAARLEALAIRAAFHPRATYLGRLPDGSDSPAGPGRPEEITEWLAEPSAGRLLHLACHAQVNPTVGATQADSSYLLLHRGSRLAAERVVAGAVRPLDLVVLAASNSGVGARGGYDEAFSLAATFLAAGASTVVGSLWSVPDGATSALMFMFHHFLHRGHGPRRALRDAQLWMLDERRTLPPEMPEPLRAHVSATTPGSVVAWAAFVHAGH